jgi:hypothetical protein
VVRSVACQYKSLPFKSGTRVIRLCFSSLFKIRFSDPFGTPAIRLIADRDFEDSHVAIKILPSESDRPRAVQIFFMSSLGGGFVEFSLYILNYHNSFERRFRFQTRAYTFTLVPTHPLRHYPFSLSLTFVLVSETKYNLD